MAWKGLLLIVLFIQQPPPRRGGNFLCCCKESHQRKQLFTPCTLAGEGWSGLTDAVAALRLATQNKPLRQPRDCALEESALSGPHSFFRPCASRAESFRTESRSLFAPSH